MGKFYEQLSKQLSLYVRQTAWLNTAPSPKKAALRTAAQPNATTKPLTRMETLQRQGLTPDLPPAGLAAHLVGYLFECGPSSAAGMGAAPIGWTDIAAWQHSTGIDLTAWEARTLRRLSGEYIAAAHDAQDDAAPAPYQTIVDDARRDLVAAQVRAIFGGSSKPTRKH